MHQENKLPLLSQPITSTRISSFHDYQQWQKQKKQAYRAELNQQVQHLAHTLNQQKTNKLKERKQIIHLVDTEQKRKQQDRYSKIKTQQKYMAENYSFSKYTASSPRRMNNPSLSHRDYFCQKLAEEQDIRKKQTKQHFIYQNQLNNIQIELKQQQQTRKRTFQSHQRKTYIDHVEQQYAKRSRDRQAFQNKYLRIDKSSNQNYSKQYLQYLKEQAKENRIARRRRTGTQFFQINSASPAFIGQLPCHFDRQLQMSTIEKSLRFFGQNHSSRLRSSFQVGRSQQTKIGDNSSRKNNFQNSYVENMTNQIKPKENLIHTVKQPSPVKVTNVEHHQQSSQRHASNQVKQKRQFKYIDIISGSSCTLQI